MPSDMLFLYQKNNDTPGSGVPRELSASCPHSLSVRSGTEPDIPAPAAFFN